MSSNGGRDPVVPCEDVKSLTAAGRQYVEEWATLAANNSRLWVMVFILIGNVAASFVLLYLIWSQLAHKPPLVVRIDDVGRYQALLGMNLKYTPHEAEVRYFLRDFTTKFNSRIHRTIQQDWADSLYYLDRPLAQAAVDQSRRDHLMRDFMAMPLAEETDVRVKNVEIVDLTQSPYRARVDFEKVTLSMPDRQQQRVDRFAMNVQFVVRGDNIEAYMIPVNPLGLIITAIHTDEGF